MEALLLLLLLRVTVTFSLLSLSSSAFTPDTAYFLDCGSSSAVSASGDSPPRNFTPDSAFLTSASDSTSLSSPNPSTAIYATARVFTAKASYRFKINKSPATATHFLRLHFLPFSTPNGTLNLTAARFNVSALNRFLLLANFSPAAAAAADPSTPIIKEYLIPVDDNELVLTFDPRNSLAFVNAIELFTAPSNLLSSQLKTVGSAQSVGQLDRNALQKVYRVNVGGPTVTPANDTLWRYWTPDDHYMLSSKSLSFENSTTAAIDYDTERGQEIAPEIVYSTARTAAVTSLANPNFKFNLTWSFPVSSGYTYLVRLHFCNFISSDLFFDVYLGSDLAFKNLHTGDFTDYVLNTAFYQDFAAVPGGSGFINISLGRSALFSDPSDTADNGILNGVEIMKINNSVSNLDGGGSYIPNFDGDDRKGVSVYVLIGSILGGILAVVAGLSIAVAIFVTRRRRRLRQQQNTRSSPRSWSPYPNTSHSSKSRRDSATGASSSPKLKLGLQISFADLKSATKGFADDLVIGSGGFGKVYKGVLRDGTPVAVKRGTPDSKQGYPEFQTEILVLSRIRHRHLVSLIGYCDEHSEMLLVYEFMEKGPLKNHLYGRPELPCLSWKQRLEICIAAARGLHYLHTGYSHNIIHRDVKSSNILLGDDYLAKVSDFGLSRPGPGFGESHVSTVVKGSFGYLDPEYFKTQKLTDKSDVYSFGVMLFEVLCARPVIDQSLSREQVNLAQWALHWQRKGSLDRIVDPRIGGKINDKSLKKFGETAEKCLAEYGVDRPSIGDVLWNLEYALQLQETELTREAYEDSGNVDASGVYVPVRRVLSTSTVVDEADDEGERLSELTTSKVFSQLVTDDGR